LAGPLYEYHPLPLPNGMALEAGALSVLKVESAGTDLTSLNVPTYTNPPPSDCEKTFYYQ